MLARVHDKGRDAILCFLCVGVQFELEDQCHAEDWTRICWGTGGLDALGNAETSPIVAREHTIDDAGDSIDVS